MNSTLAHSMSGTRTLYEWHMVGVSHGMNGILYEWHMVGVSHGMNGILYEWHMVGVAYGMNGTLYEWTRYEWHTV